MDKIVLSEFQGLAQKYNGTDLYSFENIVVISGGARDPDADDVTGMSASKLRSFASDDDFASFAKGLPETLKNMEKREIYILFVLQWVLKIRRKKFLNYGRLLPKLDQDTLRESYLAGEIFNLGDIVE